ncbi:MAG: hypothetical protein K6G47_05400 [Clostridia bacterium]|nr:hypothetical protein [Clostridia bacterium]
MKIDLLRKESALSCIENYLLYLISQKKYTWEYIYFKSFVLLSDAIRGLNGDQDYSNYKGIERLHNVAAELGMVKIIRLPSSTDLKELDGKWYAIQVSTDYMIQRYNFKPWRDDHHILMHNLPESGEVEYLNDVPSDAGVMTLDEAQKLSVGEIVVLDVEDDVSGLDKKFFIEGTKEILRSFDLEKNTVNDLKDSITLDALRDAVSVAKVLVNRQNELVKIYGLSLSENDYYDYLSFVQSKLEYYRLRKSPAEKWMGMLEEVVIRDTAYIRMLKTVFQIENN